MLGFIKHLFFPRDAFSKSILSALDDSSNGKTLNQLYTAVGKGNDSNIGRIRKRLDKLESWGLIGVTRLALTHPPKRVYSLTEDGRAILAESR